VRYFGVAIALAPSHSRSIAAKRLLLLLRDLTYQRFSQEQVPKHLQQP
jgi:hypothetical protein